MDLGKELLVDLAMEGKFSGEGLNAMGDEDIMTSLARELVEQGHVGESANKIWASLTAQRAQMLSFDDTSTCRVELAATGRGAAQVFEVHRSRMSSENVHGVTQPDAVPLSVHSMEPGPVFTWSTELESCRKTYPLKTRRRSKPSRSGQLSLFCAVR
jgi:hypothetical protein